MRTKPAFREKLEFSMVRPDNRVSLEYQGERVVIRTMRDNFSLRDKSFFIRYLAAEGFIPETYQWFAEADSEWSSSVTWTVDDAKLRSGHSSNKALRQILGLVGCVALGWLLLMIFAFVHAPQ